MSKRVIILDAGHGARDPGATAWHKGNYFQEKDATLAIVLKVHELLHQEIRHNKLEVILTRSTDAYPLWPERVQYSYKADLFVSVHINSMEDAATHGFLSLAYSSKSKGYKAAKIIHSKVLGCATHYFGVKVPLHGIKDLGVKTKETWERAGELYVLRKTECPAVLIEFGFISNPVEGAALGDKDCIWTYAKALKDGILEYLETTNVVDVLPSVSEVNSIAEVKPKVKTEIKPKLKKSKPLTKK